MQVIKEQILTASDGNEYLVTVTYDNTSGIPFDAKLVVTELKEGDEGYAEYVAAAAEKIGENPDHLAFARPFDITLKNPETGEEYQPNKDVTVTIQLLGEDLNEYVNIDVIHFPGEADGEAEIMDSNINREFVEFETDGFSVYVLTGTDAFPRRTYEFYIKTDGVWAPYMFTADSGVQTSSQTVRDGQKPTIPQPEKDAAGKVFAGWYERTETDTGTDDPELATEPYNFDTPVTQDEVVYLYAVFSDYLNVIFHDQYNDEIHDFPIAGIRRGELSEGKAKIKISDFATTYSGGSEMAFYGWSRTPITVPGAAKDDNGENVTPVIPDENGCIEITAETQLYPIYRSVKWLSFWPGPTGSGATYYPAQSYFDGVGPETLADHVPTWSGYTFLGWYAGMIDPESGDVIYGASPITNADGTLINNASDAGMSVYGEHLHLTTDATLYARWVETANANYSVVIYKTDEENPVKTYSETGSVGSSINLDKYKYESIDNYLYDHYDGSLTVAADAVLKVYYSSYTPSPFSTLTFRDSAKEDSDTPLITASNVATGELLSTHAPNENPVRNGYSFSGWFLDKSCTKQVDLATATMPDHDLTLYAGWEVEWYLVQIDPNYGSFNGTGSTWTWKTIESDLIQEYTQVTRDYVESSSGQYYYYKHDRAYYGYYDNGYYDNEPSNRDAGYTNKPGQATEYKRFEEAPGIYSYAGWYEVLADGTEIPYDFSQHVDHHTVIRLHWKKAGNFYLRYYDGKSTDSITDDTITPDAKSYADNAQILIKKGATDPEGYTFVGWRVQGDTDGPVYGVGKTFILNSDDAISISGKNTVTLEAVYVKLGTAKIIYNFNGGTADATFDYGHPEDQTPGCTYEHATDGKTATVSYIVNNSGFYLSNGTGLTMTGATLEGWSDLPVYDPDAVDAADHFFALGFDPDNDEEIAAQKGLYGVDTEEPITLYAVWKIKATWHLNVPDGMIASDFTWGGDWNGYENETVDSEVVKTKTVYQGNVVAEPSDVPKYNGTENRIFISWVNDTDSTTAYDYSQPVTGALDLYAYWALAKTVTAHAVDASAQTLVEKTYSDEGWTVQNITVGPNEIDLNSSGSYATAPEDYTFAFAAVSQDLDSVSSANEVTHIKYDSSSQKVKVIYKGESAYRVLDDDREIYFVYYQKKSLNIGYKEMQPSGVLDDVTGMSDSACSVFGPITENEMMATGVTAPLAWGNNEDAHAYTYYAFAIGKVDLNTLMNASDLSVITAASDSDESRPVLRVRNTWRGFEYTTSSGDDAVWTNCGYQPQLYVIYYKQQPTVIMFSEQTVGLDAVMDTKFTFNLKVTETTTHVQKQKHNGTEWVDVGSPEDYTSDIFNTEVSPNSPYVHKNGEANSAILFYSVPRAGTVVVDEDSEETDTFRYIATEDSVTSQTVVITQKANADFTTSIDGTVQDAEPYQYTFTSDDTASTQNVVFTNKHKAAELEVHVARIENGSIVLRDELRSTTDETTYKFSQPIDGNSDFLTALPESTVYTDASGVYTFGMVVLGTDSGNAVTVEAQGAANVTYGTGEGDSYALWIKDGNGTSLGDLGNRKIYYLYYPMPKIQYIKQEGETLSRIMGSTDGINQSTSITYGGAELQMNGVTVTQDQRITLPLSGLRISQKSGATNFKMPPILDDGTYQHYLTYTSIGVGSGITSGETQEISALGDNVSDKLEMRLQIKDNALQWSFDGASWQMMDDAQTIYAIYTESGYDLQLSKIVNTSVSGSNPIFTDRKFTLTIQPAAGNSFKKIQYDIEGYSSRKINVEDGKLTLTVEDGTNVKILGLRRGGYVITESNNENYDLSAKSGPIVGTASKVETVTASSINLNLDDEKQLVLTNSPKALCEVVRGSETDGVPFYTLADAIKYIVDNFADGTATIAMLSDYLMPTADTLVIPSSAHITLTTATRGTQKYPGTGRAVISRSAGLNAAPMIANNGELTLINITIDGKSVAAREPMLRSAGTLTVDRGATLKKAVNSGNGGAISATGTVAITGTENVYLQDNQAANGGLLYYSGTGAVTVSGGSMNTNIATNGSGGAIYAVGGTLTLSGGTFSGNTAPQNGGAVYGENAVIMLSGSTVTGNKASGSGGAVYSAAGAVTVSGGSVSNNTAAQNGGAICTDSGKVTVSGGSVNTNEATNGSGGAIYTNIGAVEISGTSTAVNGNKAKKGNGGAVYANTGSVTISGGSVDAGTSANLAKNGGAVYAASGTVKVSGGSITGNTATENGGAIYAGSGTVSVSGGSMAGNSATGTGETTGFGGAVYVDTGSAAVSGGSIGDSGSPNSAKNGSAVYLNAGTGSFSGGTVSGNTSTAGGAVGVGAETVRLEFSGTAQITGNTMGGAACNVYLDQDTDGVINTGGFESGAYVGIYVPDTITVPGENPGETKTVNLFKNRGDVGAEFGIYSGSGTTVPAFHNDREANLTAAVDTSTMRIYWSSPVKVEVRYLASFSSELPNGTNGVQKLSPTNYNPMSGGVSLSVLADEVRGKCSNLSSAAVYATALVEGDLNYDHYLTKLLWEEGKWRIQKRDGSKVDLNGKKIVIYYADPTFLSIENNSNFDFDLTSLTVTLAGQARSLLNNADAAGPTGFGLVFARDGSIQEELSPAEMTDGKLTLSANGGAINLLIPGGRNAAYALDGSFDGGSGSVMLRVNGTTQPSLDAGKPVSLNGTTFNNANTYEIVFGEDKAICRIRCAEQADADESEYVEKTDAPDSDGNIEYTFAKMRDAITFAKTHGLTEVTVEMLVDYLMPGTDAVMVTSNEQYKTDYAANNKDHPVFIVFEGLTAINFTTATTGTFKYPGTDPKRRATVSRGNGNTKVPLLYIAASYGSISISVGIHDLNFDGKNLTGACDGGALKTCNAKVTVDKADFKNFIALNGGAVFVSFGKELSRGTGSEYNFSNFPGGAQYPELSTFNDETDTIYTNAVCSFSNAKFDTCESQAKKERSGGGAIWTNAKTISLTECSFNNCKSLEPNANNQGGAVFHRIDMRTQKTYAWQPYALASKTIMNNCSFTSCRANAGGGIESDALYLDFQECRFVQCTTKTKDGGAINMYIFQNTYFVNEELSEMHLTNCTFTSCNANRNAGAVRSLARSTYVNGCTFANITAQGSGNANYFTGGGAVCISNQKAAYAEFKNSSFIGSSMNKLPGGAICSYSKELLVEECTFSNCKINGTTAKNGGCIYHYLYDTNKANSSVTITGSTFTDGTSTQHGGGLYSNAITATITGSTFQNCVTGNAGKGGGVCLEGNIASVTVSGSTFKLCQAKNEGGGLYSVASAEFTVNTNTEFDGCTSGANGGGIYHVNKNSAVLVSDTTINGCTAAESGGGFYTSWVKSADFTGCTISSNKATNGSGGGIFYDTSATLSLTNTTVSGNSASNMGGGIYTKKYLTLVRSIIEENELTTNTVANAAGVYMTDDGLLVIGASGSEIDNSAVMNNTTANGADSNLRMPVYTSGAQNGENKNCVTVNCPLGSIAGKGGYIGVTNAWKVGTQFGKSNITGDPTGLKDPDGVVVKDTVFNADTSTLYGIISRTDITRKQIVWAGPPVCKITDADGNLLYFKNNGSDPAIFDVLENGVSDGRTSAFSLLRGSSIKLYYEPESEGGTGTQYTGTTFTIKMLVETYELTNQITTVDSDDKTIILTTAGKRDTDGYPFDNDASGTRAEITRGSGVTGSMVTARTNMQFRNILMDGGNTELNEDGAIVSVAGTNDNITVELQANAVFQNGKAENGGAVAVKNGTFGINGGLIRFCEAATNGGAVYANHSNTEKGFVFAAGNIQQCSAVNGGGVYVNDGAFTMSGGSISGCAASGSGGGVYVAAGKIMNMSGGRIGTDGANTAVTSGGGIAAGTDAQINFTKQVNISRNTCAASEVTGKICNLQLDQDSNTVIRTEGLYARSYIGVYVPGGRDDENPDNDTGNYAKHGGMGDSFGFYKGSTSNLYCFVNDRNGLKGGRTDPFADNMIYWIKIFSIEISKEVEVSENAPVAVRSRAKEQNFTFTVRLWDTPENISSIKVKDIADEIAEATIAGEDSKYGNIPFVLVNNNLISAVITMKSGEMYAADNLPDGLGYDVTETSVEGYANIPDSLTMPINFREGKTGENKSRTDVNPYVSTVAFKNILPICKITDASGKLLYRNPVSSKVASGKQTPAVYKDLGEAFTAINGGSLYTLNFNLSYSGNVRIEMLLPDYTLSAGQTLTTTHAVTLTTAPASTTDGFPFNPTGADLSGGLNVATIKRASTNTTGSMLTLSANSDCTITDVKIDGNLVQTNADGGLVYVPSGAKLTVKDGAILQNSRTSGNGAGVYIVGGGQLYLSGNPVFGTTDTDAYGYLYNNVGNFKADELTEKKNGGKNYKYAHQDIYLAGTGNPLSSIVITGALDVPAGSIWVWADHENHYQMLKQFAVFDASLIKLDEQNESCVDLTEEQLKKTYEAFRNAQTDDLSLCGGDSYLTGKAGENASYVYWTGGFDVLFKKSNSFGEVQSGAVFTLYKDAGCLTAYQQNGADVTATSADTNSGVTYSKNGVPTELEKGIVLFQKIPAGVYYVKETVLPDGYVNSIRKDDAGDPISNVYLLLVGETALAAPGSYGLTAADITTQTDQYSVSFGNQDYAIFLFDSTTNKAVTTPDIAKYGIMNIPTAQRKAILRKVEEGTYKPLPGAVFEILRYDRTKVSSTDINGATTTSFTSGNSGVYFIDKLPFGTYYLHETKNASGTEVDIWFTLTVNETGVGYEEKVDTGTSTIRNTLNPESTAP